MNKGRTLYQMTILYPVTHNKLALVLLFAARFLSRMAACYFERGNGRIILIIAPPSSAITYIHNDMVLKL